MNESPAEFESGAGLDGFRSAWRILSQSRFLFVLLTLLIYAAVVGGYWVQRTTEPEEEPEFVSTTRLVVTPPAGSADSDAEGNLQSWLSNETLLRQLLLSEEVLTRVVTASCPDRKWRDLREVIELEPLSASWDSSYLIEIRTTGEIPEESQKLADALVKEFIAYTQELAAREVIAARLLLEQMAKEARREMEDAQKDILAWRKQNDAWNTESLIGAYGDKVGRLEDQLAQAETQAAEARQQVGELEAFLAGKKPALPWAVARLNDPGLTSANAELVQARARLRDLEEIYTSEALAVQAQRSVVLDAHESYQRKAQALIVSLKAEKEGELARAEQTMAGLGAKLAALEGSSSLAAGQVELEQLERRLQVWQTNYDSLMDQINNARVLEQRRRHLAAFTVVDKALPGVPPATGKGPMSVRAMAAMAFPLSLLVAAGLLLLLDYLRAGLRLKPRVEEALGVPVLGLIARLPEHQSDAWAYQTGNSSRASRSQKNAVEEEAL